MSWQASLDGLLLRAADDLTLAEGTSEGGRAHGLRELVKHLREVRNRHRTGDSVAVLDEFFDYYTLEES